MSKNMEQAFKCVCVASKIDHTDHLRSADQREVLFSTCSGFAPTIVTIPQETRLRHDCHYFKEPEGEAKFAEIVGYPAMVILTQKNWAGWI